jgi:hypothetical protein
LWLFALSRGVFLIKKRIILLISKYLSTYESAYIVLNKTISKENPAKKIDGTLCSIELFG